MDKSGNLFGTTPWSGKPGACNNVGCGNVFEVTPGGAETVLYNFCQAKKCADGEHPFNVGNLVIGPSADAVAAKLRSALA